MATKTEQAVGQPVSASGDTAGDKWHLKKNNDVYDALSLEALQVWAAEGRITPEDVISQDEEHWMPASDLEDLEMEWIVELPDGSMYGPLHLMALQDALKDGTVLLHSRLQHKMTGEVKLVGEALIEALTAQKKELQSMVDMLSARAEDKRPPAATPTGNEAHWQQKVKELDHFAKESGKWKKMYHDEVANAAEREGLLEKRVGELRENELQAVTKMEQAEHRLSQAEKAHKLLKETIERKATDGEDDVVAQAAAQVAGLMESYNDLSRNYDTVLKQLMQKSEEMQEVLESRSEIEKETEKRLEHMEELMKREQDEADKARKRLAEMEESHLELLRAYRDMNDRYIRLRQQQMGGVPPGVANRPAGSDEEAHSRDRKRKKRK